jgi:hypothetical protein
MPEPGTDFAAHVTHVCAGFRAEGPPQRMRKSELLSGTLDGKPVIAKRLVKRGLGVVLEREIAIIAFTAPAGRGFHACRRRARRARDRTVMGEPPG